MAPTEPLAGEHTPDSRARPGSFLSEPLVHFLVLGALIFAAFEFFGPGATADSDQTIVVDRAALLTFMQYRTNAFEFDLFNRQLDELSESERRFLIDEFIREEVLYREAQAMGLEENDYIIRQRLVQKMEFLIEDTVARNIEPVREDLEKFYADHMADYVEPPVYTFTHVFFDREARGEDGAENAALAAVDELNAGRAGFSDAVRYGDRPLFYQNYVERTEDFVLGHLGEDVVVGLQRADVSDSEWIGPFPSPYGWHVVLMTEKRASRLPGLSELEGRVREDYQLVALDRAEREAVREIVGKYDVEIENLD
jgi:hypothetical protein